MAVLNIEILILSLVTHSALSLVPCPLNWYPDGYGNYPPRGLESGSGDYVARVFHGGEWIPGRMSPTHGKAYITDGVGNVYEHETYEILTNPEGCVVNWVEGYGGSIPPYGVSADTNPNAPFIGQAIIGGKILGGKVVPDDSAIYIAFEGVEESRRNYHVLTSTYPTLQGSLSSFKLDLTNLRTYQNHSEIIGQEEIWLKTPQSGGSTGAQHRIVHSKMVQEFFTLSNADYDWTGISHLSFSLPLWYGSSDVVGDFDLDPNSRDLRLTIKREREISIERTVTVGNSQHFEACSVVSVYDDPTLEIPFEASGLFSSDSLSGTQISKVLQELGFTVMKNNGKQVVAIVRGNLSGRFAIHPSTFLMLFNYNGICNDAIW